ncbi:MAG TPA: FlgD immunoglobulin-like domain containing protein [Rectinemataceae bacterium]|nr:FlgD immunoglobulin-like domain containing protein [Rectinemataceae bacterium]
MLAGTTNSGNANAVILPYTNGTLINLGGADAAGTLGLTSAELTTISVAGPGVLEIGNASTGAVTVSAPVAASGAAILHVRSGAGMSGAGNAITVPNLALSAAGAINVSTAASVIAAVTTAGGVTIGDANAAGLAIGTVDGVVGIASGNTAISVTETAGLLTVSQAVNAGTSSASLAGVGVTNNATVTGGGGITIAAGTGTFVNSGGATLANGGGATLVSITADDMDLLGTIAAGSGPVNLTTASVLQPIYLGTGTLALGLSSLELNTIATTGTLTIGDAAHTGTISTDGGLSLSGPAGPVALLTRGGIITLDNAVTTAGNLSANTTGSAATAGNVSGTGQLIIGAAGANSLTVVTSNGISLTNPANLANAVSLTNGSAAGAIAFYNNRNMSLTASNASTGGAITVVNGTGTLSLGTVTSTGAAAYVSLSSAGAASQTGVITAPGGLLLLGAGPYTLGGANAVPLMAANVTGAGNGVSFNSAAILTVGTVSGTSGVTTNGGNLALTTNAGDLTISQPISTGAGTVTLNPAANIGLSYVTAVITTTGAAVNLQRPVILGANSVIASGAAATSFSSTVDDSTANAHSLQVSGNASFAGAVGATPIASLVVTGTTSTSGGATAITTGTTQEYDGAVTLGVDTNFTGGAGQLVWFKSTIGGGGTAHAATITNADVEFDALVGGAANLLSTLTITTGATALNANVTTTGAQSYGGPVALGLDATFTAPAGSLVWFKSMLGGGATTRSITIVTASAQFDGAVGGAANLVTSLSVGAGAATALNANVTTSGAQSYGGPVSLGADASTITGAGALTFGSTVGQSGSRTLTVQDASSTGPVTFSGAVTLAGLATGAGVYNLAINAGGTIANAVSFANTGALVIGDASSDVFTASSGMTASAGTNTFQGTVATDLAAGHNIAVSNLTVGSGGLTINAGSGNFSFTATVSVGNVQTAVVADPTDDPTDLTITAALVDGSVSGTLQLSAGATVDLGSSDFNIKTLTNPGQDVVDPVTKAITRSVGIVRLTGLQATHAVSSAGYGTSSGAFLYYGAGGTIFTTGLVDSSVAPGPYNYWDLIVAGPGSFTPEADLVVRGSIRIKAGSLSAVGAPDRQISLGGSWRNDVGSSGFSAGGDLTRGVRFLGLVNPVYVWGDNDWFLFYCAIPGLTIRFENGSTQRILGGGAFVVRGSSASHIVLDRIDPSGGNPLNPPTAAEDGLFWFFDLVPPATLGVLPGLPMEYVDVYYSNAVSYPVSVPANVVATPYALPAPGHYCYKWLSFLFAIYSYTEDSNYDGKIDRIRVTTEAAVGNDFSGFTASVSGYAVTGYFRPVPGNTFYILLKEQPYDDTGAVPDWRISANTSLKDESTNSRLVGTLSRLGGSDWMTPGDTAWPLIGYTLTLPGNDGTFVHFSEPVVQSGGASLAAADFSASSFTRVSGSAPATTEALATLGAFGTAVLAAGATTLSVTASTEDLGAPPHWEITYDNQIIGPPPPTYPDPAIGYLDDASSYGSYGSPSPNPGPITRPSFRLDRGGENIHRITDLLASIQPSSVPGSWSQLHPDSYFAWPVYAKDRVSIALTDAQIAALTPAQTAAEGIGLIRAFDGSQWLRDQDLLLQLNLAAGFANAPSVVYDSNVDASLVDSTSGLWLPPFLETDFSGLAPAPDSGVSTKAASSPPPSPPLYDYLFSASDPKVFSIAQFDFWLHLQGAPANLYAGRLSMAQDAVGLPGNWYRLCRPFSFGIHDVRLQRGGASILNNVIDPTKGETARLSYQLPTSGAVTVTVFTLDGDVVKRLVLATQAAGDYAVDWDGRNMSGHPVARGIYFIRVVAPNIDEIRKVLVVRK